MEPDLRTDAEFFDLPPFMLFAGFLEFLFALIAKLGEIRQLADRGVVQGSDFDEVCVFVLSDFNRFLNRPDS